MLNQTTRVAVGVAALLGLSFLDALAIGGRPALAVVADKVKSYQCNASTACVTATNSSGTAVSGSATSSNGVQGISSSTIASGVYGEADHAGGGIGVYGRAFGSTQSVGVLADGGPNGALPLYLTSSTSSYITMLRGYWNGTFAFSSDSAGNLTLAGELATAGSCYFGCSRGRRVLSYASTGSDPTIEDTGEAQLRDGAVSVRLDDAFSNAIDGARGYIVLLTPEGPTKGLFVAQRTSSGFIVREMRGGRDSLAFAYRLVAHPYGVQVPRLPAVDDLGNVARFVGQSSGG